LYFFLSVICVIRVNFPLKVLEVTYDLVQFIFSVIENGCNLWKPGTKITLYSSLFMVDVCENYQLNTVDFHQCRGSCSGQSNVIMAFCLYFLLWYSWLSFFRCIWWPCVNLERKKKFLSCHGCVLDNLLIYFNSFKTVEVFWVDFIFGALSSLSLFLITQTLFIAFNKSCESRCQYF